MGDRRYNLNRNRTPQINIVESLPEEVPQYRNSANKLKIMKRYLDLYGPLSFLQFKNLTWLWPYIWKQFKYFWLNKITNNIPKNTMSDILSRKYIYSGKPFSKFKFLHYTINIDNLIKVRDKYQIKNSCILSEDKLIYVMPDMRYKWLISKKIRPDWILFTDDTKWIIFIETDLWTESSKILKEKDRLYIQLIQELKNDKLFTKFKVIFFWSKRRINNVKVRAFPNLTGLNLIEFIEID